MTVTQYRSRKPIDATFHIADWVGTDALVCSEDPSKKSVFVELHSWDNLQEITEAVRQYAETNYFNEKGRYIPLSDIWP